jgi:hypothetical protein
VTLQVFLVVTLPGRVGGMAANEPINPVVRLAISQGPEDAPRGAVSTFCGEYEISRKSFYELRKRVRTDGQAAVLEPRSRRPRSWHATQKADPPRPRITPALFRRPPDKRPDTAHLPESLPAGTVVRKLTSLGTFGLNSVKYLVDAHRAFEHVLVVQDEDQITVIDLNGEVLLQTTRPAPGTTYVGRPHQRRPDLPQLSPKS